jgi:hypothetical protein
MYLDFNLAALFSYLNSERLNPEVHKETEQLHITYKLQKNEELHVFFHLHTPSKLLQIVAYLPYQLPEKTLGETARLLHFLNKEMDVPGFGLDEKQHLIFYRVVLPCLDDKIETRLFNLSLGAARVACDSFMRTIVLIVSGAMNVTTLMKEGEIDR